MCLLGIVLGASPVRAAEPPAGRQARQIAPKAAVLPLSVDGTLSEVDEAALGRDLVDGLRRGAFELIEPNADTTPGGSSSCADAACYRALAAATGATHLVHARVTVADRDYDVAVELIDGRSGVTIATSEEGCEICGVADAGTLMSSAAATLRAKLDALASGPAVVSLASSPRGAEVRVDGKIFGTTPLEQQVVAGKHVVRVSKEGFIAVEREVTFVDGVRETLAFELEKVPSRLPSRPWGWVSLALGLAGVGGAIGFAAIRNRPFKKLDGSCYGQTDDDGDCERVWSTEYHVLGFALGGAALTTLGIAILINSPRRGRRTSERSASRTTRIGLGMGTLNLSGAF